MSSPPHDCAQARSSHHFPNPDLEAEFDRLCQEVARLRLLVETTTDVVSTATNNGLLTWISDSVTATLGWYPSDLVGQRLIDFVHPDDYAQLMAGFSELERGRPTRAEIRVRRADGEYCWINLIRRQIFAEDGTPAYCVGGWRDVSAEKYARDALAESHDFVRTLLDAMLEPFVLLAAVRDETALVVDFAFADANPAALEVYDMAREELLGQRLSVLHPAAWPTGLFEMYSDVVEHGAPMLLDDWSYPQDIFGGEELRYDVRCVRVGDAVMQVWRDVTNRFEVARRLERLALYDGLTGALNHSEALHRLDAMLSDVRSPGGHLAVLFCDTDMFKEINDNHGHAAGDQVLVELTRRIEDSLRREDVVARMGGDEFLVILTGVHDLAEAVAIAEKIRGKASAPISLANLDVATSLSIGVTLARPGDNMDRLLERADVAMYNAKRDGRNAVRAL